MTREKAVEILTKHNEWRRDNSVPSKNEMQEPKEIGEAIDFAISYMQSQWCNCEKSIPDKSNSVKCSFCGKPY